MCRMDLRVSLASHYVNYRKRLSVKSLYKRLGWLGGHLLGFKDTSGKSEPHKLIEIHAHACLGWVNSYFFLFVVKENYETIRGINRSNRRLRATVLMSRFASGYVERGDKVDGTALRYKGK